MCQVTYVKIRDLLGIYKVYFLFFLKRYLRFCVSADNFWRDGAHSRLQTQDFSKFISFTKKN